MRRMIRVLGGVALLLPAFAAGPTLAAGAPLVASAAYASPTTLANGRSPRPRVGGVVIWRVRLESLDEADRRTGRSQQHIERRREQLFWGNRFDQWDRQGLARFLAG